MQIGSGAGWRGRKRHLYTSDTATGRIKERNISNRKSAKRRGFTPCPFAGSSFPDPAYPPARVDIRLPEKKELKLPWRETGPPNYLDDAVDSGQKVVNKGLSLYPPATRQILKSQHLWRNLLEGHVTGLSPDTRVTSVVPLEAKKERILKRGLVNL
jgi:hypothetical protein